MKERRKIKQIEILDKNGELDYTIIPNYKVHDNFMTSTELKFYKFLITVIIELKNNYNLNLSIFTQVALNRIIDVNNTRNNNLYEKICDRSIDFVLYNTETNKIHCCIELNDETHNHPKRQQRDVLIEKALKDNIKIIFKQRQNHYDLQEMITEILN